MRQDLQEEQDKVRSDHIDILSFLFILSKIFSTTVTRFWLRRSPPAIRPPSTLAG